MCESMIVPTTVQTNWENEFNRWGRFRLAVGGSGDKNRKAIDLIKEGGAEILILSYDIYVRNVDEVRSPVVY